MVRLFSRGLPVRPLLLAVLGGAMLGGGGARAAESARVARAEANTFPGGTELVLVGPGIGQAKVKSFVLAGPDRLVLDFQDTVLAKGVPADPGLRVPGVKGSVFRQYRTAPDVARLVLTLTTRVQLLRWQLLPGKRPEEVRVRLQSTGPVTLRAPVVEKQAQGWVVRLPGVGCLERRTGALDNPARIFLDFTNAEIPASSGRNISAGPIAQVRMGQQAPAGEVPVARVAIELRSSQSFAESVEGDDLVLSFRDRPARDGATYYVPPPPARPAKRPLAGRHIVIDAGHSNSDPGTIWETDTEILREADIALAFELQLEEKLKKAGAKVTKTPRRGIPSDSLIERVELTNRVRPDAFISIHCNSIMMEPEETPSPTACGTEVWFTSEASQTLAMLVEEEVVGALGTHDRGIKYTTSLAVVNRACCPAILVEVGFITDAGDRALLTDPASQAQAAEAMVRGLVRFLQEGQESEE